MSRFIPYSRQWIDEKDIAAVTDALKSPFITQGPRIEAFEKALAQITGARFAVVFNSGTSALHAAYYAAGLKSGDEVITSPITFVATANAAIYLGARPVFADVNPHTGNLDIDSVIANITDATRVIVPVHYAGNPVHLQAFHQVAQQHQLIIIEDACHALGAEYMGKPIGACTFSDMAVFSFHPLKHITTGEGGAVVTNNERFYDQLRHFRTHGITKDPARFYHHSEGPWYHEMQSLGYNYRMTDIQAALGLSQLEKLARFVDRRRQIAQQYQEAFADSPFFEIPLETSQGRHAYHLFPILLNDPSQRRKVFEYLRKAGLGVQVHYIPIYRQPYYQSLGYRSTICPSAEEFYSREISIPIYPAMTRQEVEYVITTVEHAF